MATIKSCRYGLLAAAVIAFAVVAVSQMRPGESLAQAPTAATAQPGVVPTTGAVGSTTIATTGAVTSDTKISVGTLAGEALMWVIAAFSIPIAGLIMGLLYKLMSGVGFSISESHRARLQELVVNGLNAAGTAAAAAAHGKGNITVGSPIARTLVAYVKEHGSAVVKSLAKDPDSKSFEEAVVARANRALNDPKMPTPASITPLAGMPISAATKLAA